MYDRHLQSQKRHVEAERSGMLVLDARAAAHQRCPASLDVIQAYSQVVMSGDTDVFIVDSQRTRADLVINLAAQVCGEPKTRSESNTRYVRHRVHWNRLRRNICWMASRESLQQQPWVSCDAGVLEGTRRPHDNEESLQQQRKTRRRHIGRATSSYWAALHVEAVEESNTLACLSVPKDHQPIALSRRNSVKLRAARHTCR